jgi:hypothetical protein
MPSGGDAGEKLINQAIISFWFKTSSNQGPEDKWNKDWFPKHIETVLGPNQMSAAGGSYYLVIPQQFIQPHLWTWPPGPEFFGEAAGTTFKDNMVPFISWGDPKQSYKRVEWKIKVLRTDYWAFLPGRGSTYGEFVGQYPGEPGGGDAGGDGGSSTPAPALAPAPRDSGPTVTPAPGSDAGSPPGGGGELGVVPPSCIGVYKGKLRIILQTSSRAKYRGYAWAMGKAKAVHIKTPLTPFGGGIVMGYRDFSDLSPVYIGNAIYYDDVSGLEFNQHPETFIMDPDVYVADDQWHHILLSWDMGGGGGAGGGNGGTGGGGGGAGGSGTAITVEATGPDAGPPLPGTWGQYSGIDGPNALAPARYMLTPEGPNGTYSYAQQAAYGAPFEDNGLGSGPTDGAKIDSICKAWLVVDGNVMKGRDLHFAQVWDAVKQRKDAFGNDLNIDLGDLEDGNAIVPVSALIALTADPRLQLTTNQTGWERDYRTLLGGFTGPEAIIDVTDEKRRFTYDTPKYELEEVTLPRGNFSIPAGTLWDPDGKDTKWNLDCKLAELQIWTGKAQDITKSSIIELFNKNGNPVPPYEAEQVLGKPNIKMHFASNWKTGNNTGSDGYRTVGDGQVKKKQKLPAGQMTPTGTIDRYDPDLGSDQ